MRTKGNDDMQCIAELHSRGVVDRCSPHSPNNSKFPSVEKYIHRLNNLSTILSEYVYIAFTFDVFVEIKYSATDGVKPAQQEDDARSISHDIGPEKSMGG